ncbi:hypothetical protein ZWY2020_050084 [Hordeum vulgare]|nr:hypothetical protein ZWY2020_050084 [Hordeum vulgare]
MWSRSCGACQRSTEPTRLREACEDGELSDRILAEVVGSARRRDMARAAASAREHGSAMAWERSAWPPRTCLTKCPSRRWPHETRSEGGGRRTQVNVRTEYVVHR